MTQILGLVTDDYAIMVSDRMVSFVNADGKVKVRDNSTCKLICYCGELIIGYSGLAEIGGERTESWIARKLATSSINDVRRLMRYLSYELTQALAEFSAEYRNIELAVIGWGSFDDNRLVPFVGTIEYDKDKSTEKGEVVVGFSITPKTQSTNSVIVNAGYELNESRFSKLFRDIRSEVLGNNKTINLVNILKAEIIRTALSDANSAVGTNLLCAVLPKLAVEENHKTGSWYFVSSEASDVQASFMSYDGNLIYKSSPIFAAKDWFSEVEEIVDDPVNGSQSIHTKTYRVS